MSNLNKSTKRNLVVDLDGTLVLTDMLFESLILFIKFRSYRILFLLMHLLRGKVEFKNFISNEIEGLLNVKSLPYNQKLIKWIYDQKKNGAKVFLATATHESIAKKIGLHLKLFDGIFATKNINLKGLVKKDCLISAFGKKGYEYVGNAKSDLPVWESSSICYIVAPELGVLRAAQKINKVEIIFNSRSSYFFNLISSLRAHQWTKNILIFVPLFASHNFFDLHLLSQSVIAFLTFGLCASSAYLTNDLLDLQEDRLHATKRLRPIASGQFPIFHAFMLVPILLSISFCISALLLTKVYCLVLFFYFTLAVTYSLYLKRLAIFDVTTLAILYITRIVAGSTSNNLPISLWMFLFCMFIFLSLAFLKRYTELFDQRQASSREKSLGRGYFPSDFELLTSYGIASGYISVLILALYFNDPLSIALYKNQLWALLSCPLLILWISRMWLIAHRGEMHDDPVLFVIKDTTSIVIGALFILCFVFARI
jgi:4-hydroxybenzoate polyprenyltransferase